MKGSITKLPYVKKASLPPKFDFKRIKFIFLLVKLVFRFFSYKLSRLETLVFSLIQESQQHYFLPLSLPELKSDSYVFKI